MLYDLFKIYVLEKIEYINISMDVIIPFSDTNTHIQQ